MHEELRSEADRKNLIERGFTLVELLIVIVILGILAGIVVFAVGNLTGTATNHACATDMATFTTAWNAYKAQNSNRVPPTKAADAGINANLGNDVLADLTSSAGKDAGSDTPNQANNGPFLQGSAKYADIANTNGNPGTATQWTFNSSTGVTTPGGSCN